MTKADLDFLEKELEVRVPQFLRYYLTDAAERASLEELYFQDDLLLDVTQLLLWNKTVRDSPGGWMHDNSPWPKQFLIIGSPPAEGGYFDHWAVDVTNEAPEVWFYDYEGGTLSLRYPTFPAFVAGRQNYYREMIARTKAEEASIDFEHQQMLAEVAEFLRVTDPERSSLEITLKDIAAYLVWKCEQEATQPDDCD